MSLLLAVAILALVVRPAAADDDDGDDSASLSSISGTLRAGYWTSSRALDDRNNLTTLALWTRAAPHLGRATSLVFDGWFGYPDASSGDRPVGTIREAYAGLVLGAFVVRAGLCFFVWGRAVAV